MRNRLLALAAIILLSAPPSGEAGGQGHRKGAKSPSRMQGGKAPGALIPPRVRSARVALSKAASSGPAVPRYGVALIRVNGSINPGSADYIKESIDRAARENRVCLLLELNTPGGLLKATRQIVQRFLSSPIPIVVYVSPPGAHAGSAGAFITMAGHVAAMAPGTNIGAAHPVTAGGKDVKQKGGTHMARKVEEDSAAFIRSIAKVRGRNVKWAESAVRKSSAITAGEAVKLKVVDLLADTVADLLTRIHGRMVVVKGKERVLQTRGAAIVPYGMSLKQKLINLFANPNIAYFLMMLGMIGLMVEIYHPGAIFPGVAGGICLLLAFISFQVLPISTGGILLILLGIGLLVAEIFVTSFGMLGIGGIVALVIGAVIMIDPSDPKFIFDSTFRLSWSAIVPSTALMASAFLFVGYKALVAQKRPIETGREGLLGEIGMVEAAIDGQGGKVYVHGELWNAESAQPLAKGAKVKVVAVDNMVLKVAPPEAGGGKEE